MTRLIQWNLNGLKHHLCELKQVMSENDPYCICIQETHLREQDKIHIRGYNMHRVDDEPGERRAKGGVAILIKENISTTPVQLRTHLQAVALQVFYKVKFTICNIYLPNRHWRPDDLRNIISQLPKPYIVVGDFNSHNPLWGSTDLDVGGRNIEEIIEEFELVLLNTGEGTYLNSRTNSFSALDLAFCSANLATNFYWCVMKDQLYTDHYPLSISFPSEEERNNLQKRWKLDRADWVKYQSEAQIPSTPIDADICTATSDVTQCIIKAADISIPKSCPKGKTRRVPWWNEEVAQAIRHKKTALNRFRRYPTIDNMIQFKRLRAQAKQIVLENKKKSWREFTSTITAQTPTSQVWKKIRAVVGKQQHTYECPTLEEDGKLISKQEEVANVLGRNFQQVSSTDNYHPDFKIIKQRAEELDEVEDDDEPNEYYNEPFTLDELTHALSKSSSSAPGHDTIPYEFIKNLSKHSKEKLLELYNEIWRQGNYPETWREAVIIPILKPGKDQKDPASYRPISLTCCLSKLFEKMVNYRLVWCLEEKQLLTNCQMGFRKNRSTTDNLLALEQHIQTSFCTWSHTVAVFFDLEKAYDLTWRHGINQTLHQWGFHGRLTKFIKSFLSHRLFTVKVGNMSSQRFVLENGIPQGSTLSVTLFAVAINNIVNNIDPQINYRLYVDDLCIFYSDKSTERMQMKLQQAIDQLSQNALNLGFRFSPLKTQAMHFCRLRNPHTDPNLFINGSPITYKNRITFLGIMFDSKLNWKPHIQNTAAKCKLVINAMRCLAGITWGADKNTLLRMYKALVLSKIDYGSTVYTSARISQLQTLDTVHNTGLKIALGAFRTSPLDAVYVESGVPPLWLHRQRNSIRLGMKILAQPDHPNYEEFLPNSQTCTLFQNRPTITRPVSVRFNEIMKAQKLEMLDLLPVRQYEVPPWKLIPPVIRLDCSVYKKDETSPLIFHTILKSIKDEYKNKIEIFTDGSKTKDGVGSAFHTQGQEYHWTLAQCTSIYTAELYAIWQALLYISFSRSHMQTYLICTDSFSSIQSIRNNFNNDSFIYTIRCLLHDLYDNNYSIIFVWVPSHIDIFGNERADHAARLAADSQAEYYPRVRFSDYKLFTTKNMLKMWQNNWQRSTIHLKQIQPTVELRKITTNLTRREQVTITRLRIGHTNLTHLYLLTRSPSPICEVCDTELTVKHILLYCSKYDALREQYLPEDRDLKMCLNNKEQILNMLK